MQLMKVNMSWRGGDERDLEFFHFIIEVFTTKISIMGACAATNEIIFYLFVDFKQWI